MSKYEVLDKAIMSQMNNTGKRFEDIHVRVVAAECFRLASLEKDKPPYRVLDGRLQALRKAGKIKFTPRGWVLNIPAKEQ